MAPARSENRSSVRLLKAIAGDGRNLWAVGDVKQSIYRFRGASAFNMVRFDREDFPGAKRGRLTVNYRSVEEVVEAYLAFAAEIPSVRGTEIGLRADRGASGFGLRLHPEKTRLIEFGRFAALRRWERGEGRRESFDFLGFTHRWVRKGGKEGFVVRRTTVKTRLRSKLREVSETLRKHCHAPIPRQGEWLGRVVWGYFAYHAVPGNMATLEAVREQSVRHGLRALRRRGQKGRMNWERFRPLIARFIPRPKIQHPYPNVRFDAKHPR